MLFYSIQIAYIAIVSNLLLFSEIVTLTFIYTTASYNRIFR